MGLACKRNAWVWPVNETPGPGLGTKRLGLAYERNAWAWLVNETPGLQVVQVYKLLQEIKSCLI